MEISQLRYLLEIKKTGRMSKAATSLNITPQGISAAMRRLEEDLGVTLFSHSDGGIIFSPVGEKVLKQAQIIVDNVDAIYETVRLDSMGKTTINIAITIGLLLRLPVPLQNMLLSPIDEFNVNILNEYSTTCVDLVDTGEVTFAITYANASKDKFSSKRLGNMECVYVVNKNHILAQKDVISIQDLDNMPMIMPELKTAPGAIIEKTFKQYGITLNVAYACNFPGHSLELVSNNPKLVARVLSADMKDADMGKVKILKFKEQIDFCTPYYFVTKLGKKLAIHEQLFKHMVFESCAE